MLNTITFSIALTFGSAIECSVLLNSNDAIEIEMYSVRVHHSASFTKSSNYCQNRHSGLSNIHFQTNNNIAVIMRIIWYDYHLKQSISE